MAKAAGESMIGPNGGGRDDEGAAIRGDIERTRGDMSRTVDEIEERLSPAHIKEQVASVTADIEHRVSNLVSSELRQARSAVREATVGRVEHMVQDARESVTGAGTTILDTIKANPIPAALVGLGLGWLLMSARSSSAGNISAYRWPAERERERAARRYGARRPRREPGRTAESAVRAAGDEVSQLAEETGHRVAEVASEARDTAAHVAEDVRVRGRRMASDARRQIVRAERGLEGTLRDNPLAVGAVALAIGAAIGLSLPHTHVEDEWLGEAKDRLVRRAQGVASDALHEAEEAAGRLAAPAASSQGRQHPQAGPASDPGRRQEPDKSGEPNGLAGGSKSHAV